MTILVKTGEENISLMVENPLLASIRLPSLVIQIIIIPLKMNKVINGLPFPMIFILVHNDDNWDSL